MLNILQVPDKKLRQKSNPVKKIDNKLLNLISKMEKTLEAQKDPEGVGLAAPQVGENICLFVVNYKDFKKVFINPKVLAVSIDHKSTTTNPRSKPKESKILEGCLSIPNHYGPLVRNYKIKLEFKDKSGETKVEEFTGFIAQVIQHEIDHLDGILFIDRLLEQKKPLYRLEGENWEEVDL